MAAMNLQALHFWHGVLERMLTELQCDLSTRQMTILLKVYLEPGPHTVKNLSESLQISKAAVSRALDTLSTMGYVRRKRETQDKRVIHVQRTIAGSVFLSDVSKLITDASKEPVSKAA